MGGCCVAAVGELSSVGGVICCARCRAVAGLLLCLVGLPGLLVALPIVNVWPLIVAAPAAVGPGSARVSSPCA